jgi:hypothetical protein
VKRKRDRVQRSDFHEAAEQVAYAAAHDSPRTPDGKALLDQLLEQYRAEGLVVPYTMGDFRRQYVKEHLKDLTPEDWRETVRGLPAETRRELLRLLSAYQLLDDMSQEEIENYVRRRRETSSSPAEAGYGGHRRRRAPKR